MLAIKSHSYIEEGTWATCRGQDITETRCTSA